jgi:hypothetical protein
LPWSIAPIAAGWGFGLAGAALHILHTAIFFSDSNQLFVYSHANAIRAAVIATVAPTMAAMVGLLRHDADQLVAREKLSEDGGRLQLESRESIGTTVAVLLPPDRLAPGYSLAALAARSAIA